MMALASLPICLFFTEYYAILPFLLTAAVSVGIGQLLFWRFRQEKAIRYRQTLLVVALSWAVIFAIGTLPYWLIALSLDGDTAATISAFRDVWNALFESISGFTSTGLSMARDASQLPHCLQWWRSFTQWVGGIGLVVLTLSVLEPSSNVQHLYSAETREERLAPTLRETAQEIWKIYLLYTGASILLLALAGMPPWAALNHGLAAIATGGFDITGSSFQTYPPGVQLAAVPIMIAGAISFAAHAQVLRRGQVAALWEDMRHRALWLLLVIGTLFLLLEQRWYAGQWLWIDSLFQWTSALTTCGFAVVQEQTWSPTAKAWMTTAMILGAVSGSTVGGLKLDRVVVLYQAVVWYLRLIYRESPEELRYELNGRALSEQEAHRQLKSAAVLSALWLIALGVGTTLLFHTIDTRYSLIDALFECASALGTSGLSVGITGPDLFWLGKLTLMLLMWMGRLEIVAVLVLFSWLAQLLQR